MDESNNSASPTTEANQSDSFGRPDLNTIIGSMENRIVTDDVKPNEELVIEEKKEESLEAATTENKEVDFSETIKAEREKFLEKQKLAEEKKRLEDERKALEEEKGGKFDFDDYIDKLLNGDKETEETQETKQFTPEDIEKLVQEKLEAKLAEREEKETVSRTINDFKKSITETVSNNLDSYKHINAMGEHDLVFQVIEQDFTNNLDKYGQEWAEKNMMTIDQAAMKVEKHLATELKKVLELDYMKPLLRELLGAQSGQQVQSNTLTNDITNTIGTQVDEKSLSDEDRFKLALEKLK